VMASQKLGFLKKLTPEMVLAETKQRTAAGAPAVPADFVPTTADVFAVIQEYLTQNPDLAPKVGVVYQWKIGDKRWLLDLKNGAGKNEIAQDGREIHQERQEIVGDKAELAKDSKELGGDRRDIRQDRREFRRDAKDALKN